MHETVGVAVVAAVERLAAHLAQERLLAGVDATVLLEVLRIHERRLAHVALERTLAGVGGLHVVVEQSTSLETCERGSFNFRVCGYVLYLCTDGI